MNKEFYFKEYTLSEADRFIAEFPIIGDIKSWKVDFHVKWNNTNPIEIWNARKYQRTSHEPAKYFSLERDLWVVGGHDMGFILAKIEMKNHSDDSTAIKWLRTIERDSVHGLIHENEQICKEDGTRLSLLMKTGIQTRTSKDGKPYCHGDEFGKGERFYFEQMARFRHGKDWQKWVNE